MQGVPTLLLGPPGSGRSSYLKMLAGRLKPADNLQVRAGRISSQPKRTAAPARKLASYGCGLQFQHVATHPTRAAVAWLCPDHWEREVQWPRV